MKKEDLQRHIETQLRNIMCADVDIGNCIDAAINRTNVCLNAANNSYYNRMAIGGVDPYHSCAYAILLYFLSNELYKRDGNGERAEKVYYLNKALNGLEAFYADELPAIFSMEHPLGTVFGRAKYSNYLFFYQSCTIGGSWFESKMYYPVLGEHVTMFSGVKILGNSHIGNHVILGANTYVINCDIPDYSFVFPSSDARKPIIVSEKKEEILNREKSFWK